MNGAGCRAKGKAAEREVAGLCAAWWSAVEPGCQFASTPGSGGWSTAKMRAAFNVAGDLSTTAKRWPFTVEVKRREGWRDGPLLAGKASPVWGWWAQACKAAAEEQRWPMLWLRRSREPWRVMLPRYVVKIPAIVWSRYPTGILRAPGDRFLFPALVEWEALRGLDPAAFARPGLLVASGG